MRSSPMTAVQKEQACAPSALLLILRNGSINEMAVQTNPARSRACIEETIGYLLLNATRRGESRRRKREEKTEFRSLVAGEVSAKQLGEKGIESDVSSACRLE